MCTRAVEANPSALDSSCVEPGASATVHPDPLAPVRQSCEAKHLAVVKAFIRGNVTYDSDGGLVPEPHGKVGGLAPECFWEAAGVEETALE